MDGSSLTFTEILTITFFWQPLYGNRSMMRTKMSKYEEALADGKKVDSPHLTPDPAESKPSTE